MGNRLLVVQALMLGSLASWPALASPERPMPAASETIAPAPKLGRNSQRTSFLGVDEIRPGMIGYGLTVFQGTEPARFPVRVIGVLHKFRPLEDIILIQSDDPRLKYSGAVAGMSGSPIYIQGKLIGAFAYGFSF